MGSVFIAGGGLQQKKGRLSANFYKRARTGAATKVVSSRNLLSLGEFTSLERVNIRED